MTSYLPSTDETSYAVLLQNLSNLNAQISQFVNGTASETVTTTAGQIKTLAGIEQASMAVGYLQKIIDVSTVSYIISHAASYSIGQLFRVWGETVPTTNGIYELITLTSVNKVSYADLYDLKQFVPNPFNYNSITFNEANTAAPLLITTIVQPVQSVKFTLDDFELDWTYVVSSNATYYSYHANNGITVRCSGQAANTYFSDVGNGLGITSHFYSTSTYSTVPMISVTYTYTTTQHIFSVYLNPPTDINSVVVPGSGIIRFKGVDTTDITIPQYVI